jgi:hypothetical protein
LLTQAYHGGDCLDAHLLGQGEEDVEALNHSQGTTGVSLLKMAIELLAREGTEVESKGHRGYLLRITHVVVGSDRNAVSLASCPVHYPASSGSRIFF